MAFCLWNMDTQRFLTAREVEPEMESDTMARFPDLDLAEQGLEDFDYAALGRGEHPPDVQVAEVDANNNILRLIECSDRLNSWGTLPS